MKNHLISWYTIALLWSCGDPGQRYPPIEVVRKIQVLDGRDKADSALLLIEEYGSAGAYEGRFSVQLIHCRSLFRVGRVAEADSLYRSYLAGSEHLEDKWRFNSEYLLMLKEVKDHKGMMAYADSIVACCADAKGGFRDMRALYYYWVAKDLGDCMAMRTWLDSMVYWAPVMELRLVDPEELDKYRAEVDSLCSELAL